MSSDLRGGFRAGREYQSLDYAPHNETFLATLSDTFGVPRLRGGAFHWLLKTDEVKGAEAGQRVSISLVPGGEKDPDWLVLRDLALPWASVSFLLLDQRAVECVPEGLGLLAKLAARWGKGNGT